MLTLQVDFVIRHLIHYHFLLFKYVTEQHFSSAFEEYTLTTKQRPPVLQGHVKMYYDVLTLFHHPSLHHVFCILVIPLFLLPNIWKPKHEVHLTHTHTHTHKHSHIHTIYSNIVIYSQTLDRTQMIRFII